MELQIFNENVDKKHWVVDYVWTSSSAAHRERNIKKAEKLKNYKVQSDRHFSLPSLVYCRNVSIRKWRNKRQKVFRQHRSNDNKIT